MTTHSTGALTTVESPMSGAVIQRQGSVGTIPVRVSTSAGGKLFVRLREGRSIVSGFTWREIGQGDGDSIIAELPDVPVGGEYTLELQLRSDGETLGRASVNHVLVGDIWITGGQSNMDGFGKLINTEPPSKQVHALYFDDNWDTAADPLCWYNESIDPVHWSEEAPMQRRDAARQDRQLRKQGAGPAVSFGKTIFQDTGVPIGLVVCSHGGTSMSQWAPERLSEGGASLYGSMIRRANLAGGKVTGVIWYQGESDANGENQALYKERMRDLVMSMRRDLGDPKLPFLYVQLGPFFGGQDIEVHWNALRNDQVEVEGSLAPAAMVSAVDAGLDDMIHLDTSSARRIGRRLAHVARIFAYDGDDLKPGPRPLSARFVDRDRTTLHVKFEGVNGSLSPKRDVRGFWAVKDTIDLAIETQEVSPEDPNVVVVTFVDPVPHLSEMWYGLGINPVVNLTDKADLAVPAFGPVTI
jgi:sialate O-acetylesterase